MREFRQVRGCQGITAKIIVLLKSMLFLTQTLVKLRFQSWLSWPKLINYN